MPPETKPIISTLEEMVCRNCVYSVIITREKFYGEMGGDYDCHLHFSPCVRGDWHCSSGKWLTGRRYPSDMESELNLEDFDDTYYGIVRAQKFPDAVSIADEYHVRKEVMKELETIEFRLGEGDIHVQDVLDGIKSKLNHLWGD